MKIPSKTMYTHEVQWKENHPRLGVVVKSFRATKDALGMHVTKLEQSVKAKTVIEYKVSLL